MSKTSIKSKEDQSNIPYLNPKFLYSQATERNKKRIIQMKKRKEYLNDIDSHQLEASIQRTLPCTSETTPNNIETTTPIKQDALNAFQSKQDTPSNVEVNISDLDCSLDSNDKLITSKNQCELLYKHSQPFIQLNNNLKIKAFTEGNVTETPSYLLALKQKHRSSSKINNHNYYVDSIIREERENDIENNSTNNNNNGNSNNGNTHHCNDQNKKKPAIHKSSKSGEYTLIKKHLRFDSSNENKILQISIASLLKPKKKDKAKNLKIGTSFDLFVFKPKKNIKSAEFNLLKPKTHIKGIKSEISFKTDISFSKHNSNRNKQERINSPKIMNTESNQYNSNSKSNSNSNSSNCVNLNKIINHRKNLTLTFPDQSNNINNNEKGRSKQSLQLSSNVILHKKANSINNCLTNRDAILALLEKVKYVSNDHYLNAIKFVQKSRKNIIVLIKKNSNGNSFLFQALYEIGINNEYGCKIYSVVFCPFKIHFVEIKNGYSFDKDKGTITLIKHSKPSDSKLPSFENIHCITI